MRVEHLENQKAKWLRYILFVKRKTGENSGKHGITRNVRIYCKGETAGSGCASFRSPGRFVSRAGFRCGERKAKCGRHFRAGLPGLHYNVIEKNQEWKRLVAKSSSRPWFCGSRAGRELDLRRERRRGGACEKNRNRAYSQAGKKAHAAASERGRFSATTKGYTA